jgi:hypothetical protein
MIETAVRFEFASFIGSDPNRGTGGCWLFDGTTGPGLTNRF